MNTTSNQVPVPAGPAEATDWVDMGKLHEFRCFEGPMRRLPGLAYGDGSPVLVTITGTQIRDGTIEGRFIRMSGPHWDDEIDSQTARTIARALFDAADDLDRLRQH